MSWAEKIEDATTVEAKLRVVGDALDHLNSIEMERVLARNEHARNIRRQWQEVKDDSARKLAEGTGERHLESVDVTRIFEHWCKVMGKRNTAKLTPERRTKIKARLKQGYSVADLLKAIDGCNASDFHMARGEYQGGTKYDDLVMMFNSGARVERFMEIADQHKPANPDAFLGESA